MADAKEVEFTLKVRMNKQKTKVLFAEIESNLADVLLSFLTLPLGNDCENSGEALRSRRTGNWKLNNSVQRHIESGEPPFLDRGC